MSSSFSSLPPLSSPGPRLSRPRGPGLANVGTALWEGRALEVLLQGFILLGGAAGVLLFLGSRTPREGIPVNTTAILLAVAAGLFAVGLPGLIGRTHLIRMVIGLEFLGKGASLVLITAGYPAGDAGISQATVFTLITIEAVVAAVALALVILVKRTTGSLDSSMVTSLGKGAS